MNEGDGGDTFRSPLVNLAEPMVTDPLACWCNSMGNMLRLKLQKHGMRMGNLDKQHMSYVC